MRATTDRERLAFLKRLDSAPFEITDWEAQFLDTQLKREEMTVTFSPKQRTIIDGMQDRYDV